MKRLSIAIYFFLFSFLTFGQVVYEDVSNVAIYEFLDELAGLKIIRINSVIKPYSRQFIAEKLQEARELEADGLCKLNKRQHKELMFYLQDFQLEDGGKILKKNQQQTVTATDSTTTMDIRPALKEAYDYKIGFITGRQQDLVLALNPLGLHYRDKLFTASLRPILGFQYTANAQGDGYHRWWGLNMFGYIGKHFGFYANLRDNNESEAMALPQYFTTTQGAVYKYRNDSTADYSEMRGGVTVSWNWGSFGLMKDRIVWGNNYHGSNILSGKAPSFPYIQLHLKPAKWFEFNYIHAWLNSNVVDSNRSYYNGDTYRAVYRNKFMAANMFTFIPWKGLNLSLGNSIVYADDGVQPVFLIPFMFFNSADATGSSYDNDAGQNSQIFIDISSRQIKHLSLYVTLFIDELMMSRVTDPGSLNWTSWKAGFKLTDFPFRNVSVTGEWTKTNPITYKHYIATTTFASNDYCMGHYLRDNSREIYAAVSFKPFRGVTFNLDYVLAQHGDEYPDDRSYDYDLLRFMQNKTWQQQSVGLSARYEFINNGYFFMRYLYSQQEGEKIYLPEFMNGNTQSFSTGLNIGF